jgi:hypothetical protein
MNNSARRAPGRQKLSKTTPSDLGAEIWVRVQLHRIKERIRTGKAPSVAQTCRALAAAGGIQSFVGGNPRILSARESGEESPLIVSPKREYSRRRPETFRNFHLKFGKAGGQRRNRMREKPGFPAHARVSWEARQNAALPGWRRSADRARLQPDSLLTGIFTGNFAILTLKGPIP